jgi:hypothetical protein
VSAAGLPGCARLELAQGVVPLNPQEAVFEGMLAGWARQQRSRFLREDATIGPRAAVVRRLAEFAGQYPWEWEPAEAEAFVSHLRSGRGWSRSRRRASTRPLCGCSASGARGLGSLVAHEPCAA